MKRAWILPLLVCPMWAQPSIDWKTQKTEILKHYRDLVQMDTRAGKEIKAVEYIRQVLEGDGIPSQTFALDPARPNLVARLKGNGSKRPLLILAHTDVVGVQPEKWPVDPFSAAIKDGYLWGRGSLDDKPVLSANLMVMLLLKRNHVALDRDVIFMAESGEEADTTGVGINFMVDKHYDAIDAEYSLTEGGGATIEGGKVVSMSIGTAEKLPARVRLVATGTSGHGSVPRMDNALIHVSAAVEKVGQWQTPMRLNDTTRTFFEKLATMSTPEKAARYNALLNPATADAAQAYLRDHEPQLYSMLRTSVVPTRLKAGVGDNVIPSEAEATLDIRALPDENIPNFYAEMAKVIHDPEVKIVPMPATRPPSPAGRLDTEMYRVLEQVSKKMYAGVTVMPSMSTGSSDKAQLRNKGQQSYGIGPADTREDATNFGAHSDVERLPESSLYPFVEFVWNNVTAIAASHR
jgi:acetylornithine deacetylase/succinyl-diaminopimelate desuccinylase-like protein